VLIPFSHSLSIIAYHVRIDVDAYGRSHVSEQITGKFTTPGHGLVRFLPDKRTRYSPVIEVPDHPWRIDERYSGRDLKIGDPNKLVSGIQQYRINYEMLVNVRPTFAINVIGTEWSVWISNVTFYMTVPPFWTLSDRVDFFTGHGGSQQNAAGCNLTIAVRTLTGSCRSLDPGQGVTIAIRPPFIPFFPTPKQMGFLLVCTIIIILIIPTLWRYIWAIPPDERSGIELSDSEAACLLNRELSLVNAILSLGNFGFVTRRNNVLVVDSTRLADVPLDGTIAADLIRDKNVISPGGLYTCNQDYYWHYQLSVRSSLVEKGLFRGWSRLFVWYAIFAGASWLCTWFLAEWQITVPAYVFLIAFIVLSANFLVRTFRVFLFFPVALFVYCLGISWFSELRGWEEGVWIYVGSTATLVTFYAWADSLWTDEGWKLACELFADEKERGKSYGKVIIPEDIADWNRHCYAPYCFEQSRDKHSHGVVGGGGGSGFGGGGFGGGCGFGGGGGCGG
jgi:uncharacterized membrane protein YgcG